MERNRLMDLSDERGAEQDGHVFFTEGVIRRRSLKRRQTDRHDRRADYVGVCLASIEVNLDILLPSKELQVA